VTYEGGGKGKGKGEIDWAPFRINGREEEPSFYVRCICREAPGERAVKGNELEVSKVDSMITDLLKPLTPKGWETRL